MGWYRSRFNRESGKCRSCPRNCERRRPPRKPLQTCCGKAGGRKKREPVDLPPIDKRHFLRGLRGGSERAPAIHIFYSSLHSSPAPILHYPHANSGSPAEESFFGRGFCASIGRRVNGTQAECFYCLSEYFRISGSTPIDRPNAMKT